MVQTLNQNEVDALLNAVSDGRKEGADGANSQKSGTVRYDLGNQDRIIRGRMPTLDIIHDRFIRLFRVSLSAALRKVAQVPLNLESL
jgi:flagellar motor switch protein FliM